MVQQAVSSGIIQVEHLQPVNAVSAQSTLARQIVEAIRSVVGSGPVVLHEPIFAGKEWDYVKECLDTGWVFRDGRHRR